MPPYPPPAQPAAAEPEDRSYLLKRAEQHRVQAEQCDQAGSRSIHHRMQQLYQDHAAALPPEMD